MSGVSFITILLFRNNHLPIFTLRRIKRREGKAPRESLTWFVCAGALWIVLVNWVDYGYRGTERRKRKLPARAAWLSNSSYGSSRGRRIFLVTVGDFDFRFLDYRYVGIAKFPDVYFSRTVIIARAPGARSTFRRQAKTPVCVETWGNMMCAITEFPPTVSNAGGEIRQQYQRRIARYTWGV